MEAAGERIGHRVTSERRRASRHRLVCFFFDFAIVCVTIFSSWHLRDVCLRTKECFTANRTSPLVRVSTASLSFTSLDSVTTTPSSPPRNPTVAEPAGATKHLETLIREIRRHAPEGVVDKCVAMVKGDRLESFAQGKQDWVLYHTFFTHLKHGEGFYIDAGANDPENGSNTFFFDACLGWKGICLEPNPMYEEAFRAKRTCKHLKNCLAGKEETLVLANADKGTKGFVQRNGTGISVVCRRLQDILVEEEVGRVDLGQRRVDLVSLDIEGQEYNSLKCFPFDAFEMPLWLVETRHQLGYSLNSVFGSAGYWMSPKLIVSPRSEPFASQFGNSMDNIFVRWRRPAATLGAGVGVQGAGLYQPNKSVHATQRSPSLVPALVLGPEYLPGRSLDGAAFLPRCKAKEPCPPVLPSIDIRFEFDTPNFKDCPPFNGKRHRLSRT